MSLSPAAGGASGVDGGAPASAPRRWGPGEYRERQRALAVRREAIAARRRTPGGHYRAVSEVLFELPELRSLTKSARLVYSWGWMRSGGQYTIAVSATVGASGVGCCERTWRRSIQQLIAIGVVELVNPGGGGHDNPNSYVFRALDLDYTAPTRLKSGATPPPVRYAPCASRRRALQRRDARGQPLPAVDRPPLAPEDERPPMVDTTSPIPELSEELRTQLVECHADANRTTIENAQAMIAECDLGTLWLLARHYHLEAEPAAAAAEPVPAGGEALARHIVAHFHRSAEIRRSIYPHELAIARAVVRHAGDDAWACYLAAKDRLSAHMQRGWARRPLWFTYLRDHLRAVGGLPMSAAHDEAPEPRPDPES